MKKIILSEDSEDINVQAVAATECDICGEDGESIFIDDIHTNSGESLYICYACIKQLHGLIPTKKVVKKSVKKVIKKKK